MIILFGSHARGDWVDDYHVEGKNLFDYQSDYDIYVLTRLAKHVDRIARNEQLRRRLHEIVPAPVSLIADTSKHFNQALERGRYFYVDVARESIVLFDSGRIKLSQPRELSREERLEEVPTDFDYWFPKTEGFLKVGLNLAAEDPILAAFMLHQAVTCSRVMRQESRGKLGAMLTAYPAAYRLLQIAASPVRAAIAGQARRC